MYFVRSGIIAPPFGSIRYANNRGYFWESSAYPAYTQSAFNLDFYSTIIYLSNNDYRYYGFSLLVLMALPIYFVRSGYINLPDGALWLPGINNYFWSSTTHPASIQYTFNYAFYLTSIYPSNSYTRDNDFSLRNYSRLYFVRSGYIITLYGTLRYSGGSNFTWGSSADPANTQRASNLRFFSGNAYPSHNDDRYYGYSLHFYNSP